jgi:hypothetical protein
LRRLGRDGRPGDTPPNALAIQHSAKSDYRKEIVGGRNCRRQFPLGASGRARRRLPQRESRPPRRRRRAASAESAVEGRGGSDRESLASTAGITVTHA